MTLLLVAILVGIVAAGFVVYPLVFRQWGLLGDTVSPELLDSEARKRVALAALKDVEYDHAAGKLDEADYREMRGKLEQEALVALERAERQTASDAAVVHACGFRNPPASRFCAGCGKRLA